MKRSILRSAIRIALVTVVLSCDGCGWQDNAPKAHQGKIVVKAQNSETPLSGQWEFYWNRLLTPADFHKAVPLKPDGYLELPSAWNDFKISDHPVGANGFATLRLIIDAGPRPRILGLRLSAIASAHRLWIDGRMVATNGAVGRDTDSEIMDINDRAIPFYSDGKPFAVVLQISNFRSRHGGAVQPIFMGSLDALSRDVLSGQQIALFCAGSLLIMGLYHFARYLFRRADMSSLFFGSYCLIWMAATLLEFDHDEWLRVLFPSTAGELAYRFEWVLLILALPAGYGYLWSLFPQDFSKVLLKAVAGLAGLLGLEALFAPVYIVSHTIIPFYFAVVPVLLYCIYRLFVAAQRNRTGAVFIFAGFAFMAFAIVNDILSVLHLASTVELAPMGSVAFALCQAIYLSQRSAGDLRKIENISSELDAKNAALKREMAESEQLSRQIVHISEDERRRISQDLHDGICQQLTAARLRFSVLKKQMLHTDIDKAELGELSSLLEGAVNQAYDLSLGLWPVDTGIARLAASLEEMCRRSSRAGGFEVAFHSSLMACARQSPESTKQLYRIAQEALANVVKHAQAEHVRLSVACSPRDGIRLTVEDDGIGRAAATASKHGAGLGMPIMSHRAVIIGGALSIEDRAGGGTIVSCVVPCAGAENDVACRFGKEPLHA